jgi:hypothetical protein
VDARPWLEQLEEAGAPPGALAYLAAQHVPLDEDELNAARRRALLVLAAGGDPHRELDPGARAVRSLAADLERPGRRESLGAALDELRAAADGLPQVAAALDGLRAEPELAWRWLACALLADELTEAGGA